MFDTSCAKKLADRLGVSNAFNDTTLERMAADMNDRDSLLSIISETYWNVDAYLKENERDNISALMIAVTRYSVLNRSPEHAQHLYQRYLKEGAYVPWGGSFGQSCPAPEFAKVAREQRAAQIAKAKRIGVFLLPALLAGLGVWFWLRRRTTATVRNA